MNPRPRRSELIATADALRFMAAMLDGDVNVNQLHMLMYVAVNDEMGEPAEVKRAASDLDMTLATASRAAYALRSRKAKGVDGYGLVQENEDPDDRRRRPLTLTPRGKEVVSEIVSKARAG